MAISLLHPTQSNANPLPERMLYRLSLDRAFAYICTDVSKRERFLSVVSALSCDEQEIRYRQEILQDLDKAPELLAQLLSLSSRFEEQKASCKTAVADSYRMLSSNTMSLAAAKNLLQIWALCLKRALLFVKAYGELSDSFEIRSAGLQRLADACREICGNPAYEELLAFCSRFEQIGAEDFWDFRFALDGDGRIDEFELIDRKKLPLPDTVPKKKGFLRFKREEEPDRAEDTLALQCDGVLEKLEISALSDLTGLFKSLSEQIFERFGALSNELVFYEVALKYIGALSAKGVPLCYPTVSQTKKTDVRGLYDLYLLMSAPDPRSVVPNDFVLDASEEGLLVFGNNGSGKTVYLRSVGTMQLLAQAGLPIPCKHAEVMLFSQLAAQFSESEKEFCEGNDAGRFEQEVRELAAMVDTLKEGALVFLNETFQSTAYAEGTSGLYHILRYFSAHGIRWILVSHLTKLSGMFAHGSTAVLHTADGYRMIKP